MGQSTSAAMTESVEQLPSAGEPAVTGHCHVLVELSGLGAIIVIAISTVGFKSYKAAMANPVDALRQE